MAKLSSSEADIERLIRQREEQEVAERRRVEEAAEAVANACRVYAAENPGATAVELAGAVSQRMGIDRQKVFSAVKTACPEIWERSTREAEVHRQLRETEAREREQKERAQYLTGEFWKKLSGIHVGSRFENFDISGSPQEQESMRTVLARLKRINLRESFEAGQNILFVGPAGAGKDHLMFSLAQKVLLPLNGDITQWNGAALRREVKRAVFSSPDAEAALIRSLTKPKLLLLSDPVPTGGNGLSDFQADALYSVVDQRWNEKRPIWATLNLPVDRTMRDTAVDALTAPVWDRLKHNALILLCNWDTKRSPGEIVG